MRSDEHLSVVARIRVRSLGAPEGKDALLNEDAARLVEAIAGARLCGDCISIKANIPRITAEIMLTNPSEAFPAYPVGVTISADSCEGCGRLRFVYELRKD